MYKRACVPAYMYLVNVRLLMFPRLYMSVRVPVCERMYVGVSVCERGEVFFITNANRRKQLKKHNNIHLEEKTCLVAN